MRNVAKLQSAAFGEVGLDSLFGKLLASFRYLPWKDSESV